MEAQSLDHRSEQTVTERTKPDLSVENGAAEDMNRDPDAPAEGHEPPAPPLLSPLVVLVLVLCSGVELILIAADWGLIGNTPWRSLAYQNGAFWAGLLYNWRPNYEGQSVLMFVTYAFLHSGFWHLAGNMLTLVFLGDIVVRRIGQGGFGFVYLISTLGGGTAFGLITTSTSPMVGASGALFGLAGAWQYWEWSDLRDQGLSGWPVWRTVFALVVLNVILWFVNGGYLAWETHLGGFLAGWIAAVGLARMRGRFGVG